MFVGSTFLYQIQKDETILWSVKKEDVGISIHLLKAAECQIGKKYFGFKDKSTGKK